MFQWTPQSRQIFLNESKSPKYILGVQLKMSVRFGNHFGHASKYPRKVMGLQEIMTSVILLDDSALAAACSVTAAAACIVVVMMT